MPGIEIGIFRETPFILQYLFVGQVYYWQTQVTISPGNTYYQFKLTNTRLFHIIKQVYSTATSGITIKILENPTVTDGTIQENVFCSQRELNVTPVMKIFNNPAAIAGGTTIENYVLIPNDKTEQVVEELILDRNKKYVLEISNGTAGNIDVDFNVVWYESSN
jgi:hypothetical protein